LELVKIKIRFVDPSAWEVTADESLSFAAEPMLPQEVRQISMYQAK
jgi:hypothetical protein